MYHNNIVKIRKIICDYLLLSGAMLKHVSLVSEEIYKASDIIQICVFNGFWPLSDVEYCSVL